MSWETGRELGTWRARPFNHKAIVIHVEKLGFIPRARNRTQAIYMGEYLTFALEIPLPGLCRQDGEAEAQLG